VNSAGQTPLKTSECFLLPILNTRRRHNAYHKKENAMTTTWVLVANHSNAHLFETEGPGKGLKYLRNIPHPEGRLKSGAINADKPGRSQDSMKTGGRHAMGKEHDPKEQDALRYAKHLAQVLDEGRTHNHYAKAVLVAEARLLGQLRAALEPHTAALVAASHDKDLAGLDEQTLTRQLQELLGR
jgi:protein required for attachment to host cells